MGRHCRSSWLESLPPGSAVARRGRRHGPPVRPSCLSALFLEIQPEALPPCLPWPTSSHSFPLRLYSWVWPSFMWEHYVPPGACSFQNICIFFLN